MSRKHSVQGRQRSQWCRGAVCSIWCVLSVVGVGGARGVVDEAASLSRQRKAERQGGTFFVTLEVVTASGTTHTTRVTAARAGKRGIGSQSLEGHEPVRNRPETEPSGESEGTRAHPPLLLQCTDMTTTKSSFPQESASGGKARRQGFEGHITVAHDGRQQLRYELERTETASRLMSVARRIRTTPDQHRTLPVASLSMRVQAQHCLRLPPSLPRRFNIACLLT